MFMRSIKGRNESTRHTGFVDFGCILKLSEHVIAQCDLEEDVQTTGLRMT